MVFELTDHARRALEERQIDLEWLARTLGQPQLRTPDPDDPQVERFFLRIPEFGDRVLRVAANTAVEPWRVVSVFFDRGMRNKL